MNRTPAGRCVYCTQWTTDRLLVTPGQVIRGKQGPKVVATPRYVPCCGACQAALDKPNRGLEAEKRKARGRLWQRRQTSLI